MFNQPWNAQSAKILADKQAEKERQIQTQLNELHKQTSALTAVKELTRINIECIQNIVSLTSENTETMKQIAKMTEENQKSSTKQFIASIIVSFVALLIAGASLFVSIVQMYK
jgi:DNA-binding ferritin-like protein